MSIFLSTSCAEQHDFALATVRVAVIGGGPAGLSAAEALLNAGIKSVHLYDAMPSVGRKLLLAGKGGLNITHAQPEALFRASFRTGVVRQDQISEWLGHSGPQALRQWVHGLGIGTFVGSSGKVFPDGMKAAPLLRAWLHRLRGAGLRVHARHRWTGLLQSQDRHPSLDGASDRPPIWKIGFQTPLGMWETTADVVILALGGGSWSRLGSDGAWVPWLRDQGVTVESLRPSNCGFDVAWSAHVRERYAGAALKNVRLHFMDPDGVGFDRLGEAVVSEHGLEGGLIYAASAQLRDVIDKCGQAQVWLDLAPTRTQEDLCAALNRGRGARSMSNHLKEQAGLQGVKAVLLREGLDTAQWQALCAEPQALAQRIKALPLTCLAPRPLDEAISSAGGVAWSALTRRLMLRDLPGVFCAGEMIDWEAPTGGYLLTACWASGRHAGAGAVAWLQEQRGDVPVDVL